MSNSIQDRLAALRAQMKEHGIDAYLVPTTDFHGSEYVNPHFKCREYLTGFTGSAGTLLVTLSEAMLWTDGRYFLQAAQQLEGSGIELAEAVAAKVRSNVSVFRTYGTAMLRYKGVEIEIELVSVTPLK